MQLNDIENVKKFEIKTEEVDIYECPIFFERKIFAESEITIGDLHGNAIKLIFILVKHGIAENISQIDYRCLVDIYCKKTEDLIKKDLNDFDEILSKIKFIDRGITIRLLGDVMGDRGSNDYFTLKILEKIADKVQLEIMISNHDVAFISMYEAKENGFEYSKSFIEKCQATSLWNLKTLLDKNIIEKNKSAARKLILNLIEKAYKPKLKAISYTLNREEKRIILFSHAPAGLPIIQSIANKLRVEFSDETIDELAQTIDRINKKFLSLVKTNKVSSLFRCSINFEKKQLSAVEQTPFVCLVWNKDADYVSREEEHHDYKISYVNGHCTPNFSRDKSHIFNLNNSLGKFNLSSGLPNNEGSYTFFYSGNPLCEIKNNHIEIQIIKIPQGNLEISLLGKKPIQWLKPLEWLEKNGKEISFQSDIQEHCLWAYESIYQHPYEGYQNTRPRGAHGIAHASRVSIWAKVFVHLYKLFGNQEADNAFVSEEDMKLIQIAALFHDAGREKSGKDLWDCDSALMFYYYLTQILSEEQLNEKWAKIILIAEALANKDARPGGSFYKLAFNAGEPFWKKEVAGEKTIWQKIIHDGDCLDVICVRPGFKIECLDCYQDIQREPNEDQRSIWNYALKRVVLEATEIIGLEGDSYRLRGFSGKLSGVHRLVASRQAWYEAGSAYESIEADIMFGTNYIKQFYGFENPVQVDRNSPGMMDFFFNGISSLVGRYRSTEVENSKCQEDLALKIENLASEQGEEFEVKTGRCIQFLRTTYQAVLNKQGFIRNHESGILKSIRFILPARLCDQSVKHFLEKRVVDSEELRQAASEFIEQQFDCIVIQYRDSLFNHQKPDEEIEKNISEDPNLESDWVFITNVI